MAKKGKTIETVQGSDEINDVSTELIKQLNKEWGVRVAYNLSSDEAPTTIKRWISTGSLQLDYAISNRRNGGVPEGRLIEMFGPPSIGKSHIAYQIARATQQLGGLVVYIDTENATSVSHLADMGIDVSKRFVYCDEHCTENVFKIMESTITKAKTIISKDVPILVVWDSVAATSPKQELEGDYDKDTIGLNARVISKGMRKIIGVIGQNNVTLLCLNQIRTKIGFVLGDASMVPGGKSIPFHSSVQVKLTGGSLIKEGDVVKGIHVTATIVKNKVAKPWKKVVFDILFGKGITEGEYLLDVLRKRCEADEPVTKNDKTYVISGAQQWKTFTLIDKDGVVQLEKKFTKNQFGDLLNDPDVGPHLLDMVEIVLTGNIETDDSEAITTPSDDGADE